MSKDKSEGQIILNTGWEGMWDQEIPSPDMPDLAPSVLQLEAAALEEKGLVTVGSDAWPQPPKSLYR